ncbi:MrpH family fimbial adhesin [Serratia marcescens]|uniref:MrpH family fimbial adhesin n=1 Tax=Serratia marcescens TaxID=615 RepID=UPI003F7F78B1
MGIVSFNESFSISVFMVIFFISMPVKSTIVDVHYSDPIIKNGVYHQAMIISDIRDNNDYSDSACPRSSCYAGIAITNHIGAVPSIPGSQRMLIGPLKFDKNFGNATRYEVLENIKQYLPLPGQVSQTIANSYGPLCIGLVVQKVKSNEAFASVLEPSLYACSDGSGGGAITPPPPPPPEETSCLIVEPQVTLNHRTLGLEQLDKNKAEAVVTVSCNKEAAVKLSFTPPELELDSGGKLKSTLYVNGHEGSADLKVSDTPNHIPVWSILSYNGGGDLSGIFNGSSVLVIEVQ